MTMPNYIVNWGELQQGLEIELEPIGYKGLKDIRGITKSIGYTHTQSQNKPIIWRPHRNIVLSAIHMYSSGQNGTFNVSIDDNIILHDINVHHEQKIYWKSIQPLNFNQSIQFNYRGTQDDIIAINIEYIEL